MKTLVRNEKLIRSGQVGAYKDSVDVYEFDAVDEADAESFKAEKAPFLKNRKDGASHNGCCGFPFGLESFYSIEKIGQKRFRLSITSPYCD